MPNMGSNYVPYLYRAQSQKSETKMHLNKKKFRAATSWRTWKSRVTNYDGKEDYESKRIIFLLVLPSMKTGNVLVH